MVADPKIAPMVFDSQKTMPKQLDDMLPNTSNPIESMHFKIYETVGKGLSLMEGIDALQKFAAVGARSHMMIKG